MSFSIQRAVSDGTLDTIVLSIEYFDQTDISVYVDDVLLPDGTYTWAWDGLDIKITPAVANGSEVLVRRTTKFDDMYHNFDDGAVFNDTTMDDNFRQLLFIFQEGVEGLTATDFYANLNLHGYRLRKVGNAVEPDDAVPYSQYIADALGAGQFRLLAEAAANAAGISEANSLASANASAANAVTSGNYATNSQNSATASAASAVTADNHRIAADNSATAAAASAVTAGTHETNAGNSASAAAASAAAAAASAASINDANLVHKTGNETVGGVKTFTSSPVLPENATTALQAVPKQQLDEATAVRVRATVNFCATQASGTYGRSGNTVTITMTGHGMTSGFRAVLTFSAGTGGTATSGTYVVTVTDANTFTIQDTISGTITGSPAVTRTAYIREAYNVSTITRISVGMYDIVFTVALATVHYVCSGFITDDNASPRTIYEAGTYGQHRTTGKVRVTLFNIGSGTVDAQMANISIIQ